MTLSPEQTDRVLANVDVNVLMNCKCPHSPHAQRPNRRRPRRNQGHQVRRRLQTSLEGAAAPQPPVTPPLQTPLPARLLVVPSNARLPSPPPDSPKAQMAFRARRLRDAPTAVSARMAEPPKSADQVTLSRSRSECGWLLGKAMPLSVLPPTMLQRARSAPSLVHHTMDRPMSLPIGGKLGDSLCVSSLTSMQTACPVAVRAARVFFDSATGRSVALRC